MAYQFKNNAASVLTVGVSDSALSISISASDASKYPVPSGANFFMANLVKATGEFEIIKVTENPLDGSFTIERAQEGTAAQTFVIGDHFEHRLTAGALNQFPQKDGTVQTGLNAQMVGGVQANATPTANMLVPLDANGDMPVDITGNSPTADLALDADEAANSLLLEGQDLNYVIDANNHLNTSYTSINPTPVLVLNQSSTRNAWSTINCMSGRGNMSLTTALTGFGETNVQVDAIPVGMPATGSIQVVTNSGSVKEVTYTSYSGTTFTIDPADFSADVSSIGNTLWVTEVKNLIIRFNLTHGGVNDASTYQTILAARPTNSGHSDLEGMIYQGKGEGDGTADFKYAGGTAIIQTDDKGNFDWKHVTAADIVYAGGIATSIYVVGEL